MKTQFTSVSTLPSKLLIALVIIFCSGGLQSNSVYSQPLPQINYYRLPPVWETNGQQIATAQGNIVYLSSSFSDQVTVLSGHTDSITAIGWNNSGTLFATGSLDQTVRIWDTFTAVLVHQFQNMHLGYISLIFWHPDNRSLIVGSYSGEAGFLSFWDTETWELRTEYDLAPSSASSIALSPDMNTVAFVGNYLGVGSAWEFNNRQLFPASTTDRVSLDNVVWNSEGSQIASGSLHGMIYVWTMPEGNLLYSFRGNEAAISSQPVPYDVLERAWVRDLTFSPDDSQLLAVMGDGTVNAWSITTGELLNSTHIGNVGGAAWSPYAGRLAIVPLVQGQGLSSEISNSELDVSVFVPFASMQTLDMLINSCNEGGIVPDAPQADQLSEFIVQVELLTTDSIPPACAADLIAVAEAIQAGE